MNTHNAYDLFILVNKIYDYEPSLFNKIKALIGYKFKDNDEIRIGVNLWCDNKQEALRLYGHISLWDTSRITDMSKLFTAMSKLFNNKKEFNDDIGSWNTSKVTDMSYMFNCAKSFNQDIGGWDTSNVTDMRGMFDYAKEFNQDIGGWNTSNVTDMSDMFNTAHKFNKDYIINWDTSNVTNMY